MPYYVPGVPDIQARVLRSPDAMMRYLRSGAPARWWWPYIPLLSTRPLVRRPAIQWSSERRFIVPPGGVFLTADVVSRIGQRSDYSYSGSFSIAMRLEPLHKPIALLKTARKLFLFLALSSRSQRNYQSRTIWPVRRPGRVCRLASYASSIHMIVDLTPSTVPSRLLGATSSSGMQQIEQTRSLAFAWKSMYDILKHIRIL
jgi:hypothetical protein